jgi:uncharacterized protein (TIGR02246 family)
MHYALYHGSAPARPPSIAGERIRPAMLHQIPLRFARAWNRHDVAAAFADFDANADYVDIDGTQMHGRSVIVQRHAALHETAYAKSMLRIDHVDLRRTTADSALVRADWTMKIPDGVRRGTLLFVVARRGDAWRVVSAQNTEEAPSVAEIPHDHGLPCTWLAPERYTLDV